MNWGILKSRWDLSLQEFLIYKVTSILTFVLATIFFLVEIITGLVYFSLENKLNGWSEDDYMLLISSITTISYLYNIFFIVGHENLGADILRGNLDYTLIRPVSSYWFISLSRIDIPSIFNLIISLGAVIYLMFKMNFSLYQALLYAIAIILGWAFIFIANQISVVLAFWFDGFTALGGIIENSIDLFSRPMQIFPRLLQFIFVVLLPILLVTNLPVLVIKSNHNLYYLLYLFVFDLLLYFISKIMWRKGVNHYASAN